MAFWMVRPTRETGLLSPATWIAGLHAAAGAAGHKDRQAVHRMNLGEALVGKGKDQAVIQDRAVAFRNRVHLLQEHGEQFHCVDIVLRHARLIAENRIDRFFVGGLVIAQRSRPA